MSRASYITEGIDLRLPTAQTHRPLINEPLTVEDWRAIWLAWQGMQAQIRLIVTEARRRKRRAKLRAQPAIAQLEPGGSSCAGEEE